MADRGTHAKRVDPRRLDRGSRGKLAEGAWQALPHGGSSRATLRIDCSASHHVATVYDTEIGLVYRSQIRRHAHGDRDLPDTPHRDQEPKAWFDLLDLDESDFEQASDPLPAWCECGPRMLSRTAVLDWVAAHEHRVILD